MGYGGDLIWTSVFHELKRNGQQGIAVATPMLSDILCGCLFRQDKDFTENVIFKLNSDIGHIAAKPKLWPLRVLDYFFQKLITLDPIRRRYEQAIFRASQRQPLGAQPKDQQVILVHLDMRIHSYALRKKGRKIIWKNQPFAAAAVAEHFNVSITKPSCFLVFEDEEWTTVDRLLANSGISQRFIVFDPDTNEDWFGVLRAWAPENWRELVTRAQRDFPDYQFVQIGLAKTGVLDGVMDLTSKTSFRQAAMIIAKSSLFLGTEGGLMHAAAAVDARSVILWGGVTRPEFAGYPDKHQIICKYVSCSPCGNLGYCDFQHKCMRQITVDDVVARMRIIIDAASSEADRYSS